MPHAGIRKKLCLGIADSSLNNVSAYNSQNAILYRYTFLHTPGSADSDHKQSSPFSKYTNILTRTWIHWLKSLAKNHATSSFAHKLATFSSSRPSGFCPSHCALPKIYLLQSKMSQKHCNLYIMLPIRKNATLLLTAVCGFSSYTVKNLNLLYTSLKTLQLLDFCSQSEKTYTFRLLPVRVLSCTLLKILLTTVKTNFQKLPQL